VFGTTAATKQATTGATDLDEWLRRYSTQNRRRNAAATWVITTADSAVVAFDAHVAEVKVVLPSGLNRIARGGAAAGSPPKAYGVLTRDSCDARSERRPALERDA